jgi:hypothetical protein
VKGSSAIHSILEKLEKIDSQPTGEKLNLAREVERQFGPNSEVADFVAVAMKLGIPFTHAVVLVHGIRDDAEWFNTLQRAFDGRKYVEVRFAGYGYFRLTKFLRKEKIDQAYRDLVSTLRSFQGQLTAVTVICHSFGTYCVTRAILENPDIQLFRLVMCGAIVKQDFPWRNVKGELSVGRVLNDCGNEDMWPVMANLRKWFGATGRYGFSCDPVRDRWHDIGHGDFFSEDFVRKYWVPFVCGGKIVDSAVQMKRPNIGIRLLSGRFP